MCAVKNNTKAPSGGTSLPEDPTLFCRFAREFELMAQDCASVQAGMGQLFESIDVSHLQEELRLIQLIDRVQQTLHDLAVLARRLKTDTSLEGREAALDLTSHSHVLQLDSLRARLTSDPDSSSEHLSPRDGEVTLFE